MSKVKKCSGELPRTQALGQNERVRNDTLGAFAIKTICKFLFATLILGGVTAGASPASADFTLCNRFEQTVYAAYAYDNGDDWVSEGWYEMRPQQCTTLVYGNLNLQNRYYYIYAESADGWNSWGGDHCFCTHEPNAFTIVGDDQCNTGFFEVDTQDYSDWTQNLDPWSGSVAKPGL